MGPPSDHPGRIAKALYETPYTTDDIGHLFATTASLTTKARTRYGRLLIALGLAVGPFGGEFTGVGPADVRRIGADLVVTLRMLGSGRTHGVVALPQHAAFLEAAIAAAKAAGDRYLIGGSGSSRNRLNRVLEDLGVEHWPVPIVHGRLRTTYLVGLASQRHSAPELLAQAGSTTLGTLDRILPFLDVNSDGNVDAAAAAEQKQEDEDHDEHDDEHDDEEDHEEELEEDRRWGVAS